MNKTINNKSNKKRGFMQIVLLAIVIIVGLAYFNVDLHSVVQSPVFQKYLMIVKSVWTDYIFPIFKYIAHNFVSMLNSSGDTATSTATSSMPSIPVFTE